MILEGAAQILLGQGYEKASTNRIARAAGVSVGSLYQYFDNKDAVFNALIDRELRAIEEALPTGSLHPDTPLSQALYETLLGVLGAARHGPRLFRILDRVPGDGFRDRVETAREIGKLFIRALLEVHSQAIPHRDLDLAAALIVGATEGVGYAADPADFDERLARELAEMFSAYLTPPTID